MVSIIMTAYNTEFTISNSIKSCINQTYKDLEIIIVNDKSTDNTLEIIKSFSDDRIKVINNETNVGCGLSRRIGIKNSTGDYTIFVDSDDTIKEDMIEKLLNISIKTNADIVSSGIHYVDLNGNTTKEDELYDNNYLLVGDSIISDYNFHTLKWFLSNKLIKKHLWDNVEYSERRYLEDAITCYKLFYYAKRMVYYTYCGCNYTINSNGISGNSSKLKRLIYNALIDKDMYIFACENNIIDKDIKYKRFLKRISELFDTHISKEEELLYNKELSELFVFVLNNKILKLN